MSADPGAHDVELPTAVERDRLAGDLVDELVAFPVEDTFVPEVRAPADAEERLVNVGALEYDLLHDVAILGHQEAMPFAKVWDRLAIRNLVLHTSPGILGLKY